MESFKDLISVLPESVIQIILTKLPIKDAVTTSILSTKWRYKWASLTHLVFDDTCVTKHFYETIAIEDKLVKFITLFLLLHNGRIHKFSLRTSFLYMFLDIEPWLRFISRKDVKELVLELAKDDWFILPSSVFACKKLTSLELTRCVLIPPPNFKGFSCLKDLRLVQMMIHSVNIERLISSCPILESLTLSFSDSGIVELTIRAPNLRYLTLEGEFKNLCLANALLLVDISIGLYMNYELDDDSDDDEEQTTRCNFYKLLGDVTNLERLSGYLNFTKCLSICNNLNDRSCTSERLKFIELHKVSFIYFSEVLAVLQLIALATNLEELQISGSSDISDATEDINENYIFTFDYTHDKLKTVGIRMSEVSGVANEMIFIKYLLEKSTALERMSITPSVNKAGEGRSKMLMDLVSFRRASPQATIVIHDEV